MLMEIVILAEATRTGCTGAHGIMLGASYIRHFLQCLLPSCLPTTHDVKEEEEGAVPTTGRSFKVRAGKEGEKIGLHLPIHFKPHKPFQ